MVAHAQRGSQMVPAAGKRLERVLCAGIVGFALAATVTKATAESHQDYFPLNVGNSWTYTNGTEQKTFTIIAREQIKGYIYYKFDDYFRICGFPGYCPDYCAAEDNNMLFRYDPASDRILQYWPSIKEDRVRYDFSGHRWGIGENQLIATGISRTVPAGQFEDCCEFGFGMNLWCGVFRETLAPGIGNIEFVTNGADFKLQSYTLTSQPRCGDPNHPYPVADLNRDCRVDLLDLAILASHWLQDNSFYRQVLEFYYYYGNRKIYLDLYTEMIAVYFEQAVSQEERQALITQDPILEAIVAEMARYGVVLVGTKASSSDIDIIQTIERLEKLPEVRYSTPVFGDSATQLILTDEFIAKFKPDVTEAEIDAFNTLNAVEIEDKIEGIEHYILRVKDPKNMNTLKMANLYSENPITIFSVPNFIGIGEPP